MKPILFNPEMVRAILDGRKTMTRRAIKPQPIEIDLSFAKNRSDVDQTKLEAYKARVAQNTKVAILRDWNQPYRPGDILYMRETWGCYQKDWNDADRFLYRADYSDDAKGYWHEPEHVNWCDLPRWRPSIHMPKEAARIFLRVRDVRAERLQDIKEEDAQAEGVEPMTTPNIPGRGRTYIQGFGELWNSINAKRGYGWAENPWVWVIEFEQISKEEATK